MSSFLRLVALLLAAATGGPLASAQARPSEQIASRSEQWISPDQLFEVARQEVAAVLAAKVDRFETAMPKDVRGVALDPGPVRLTARRLTSDGGISKRMSVWVDIWQGTLLRRTVLVPVEVSAWQSGWIAKSDLPAGTRLSAEQLQASQVEITADGQRAWQGTLAEDRVLRSPVLTGHYLHANQVASAQVVERGDRVEVVYRVGAVEVSSPGSALQDGGVGQHIQVRADGARGPVLARVVGTGRVELLQ